MGFEGPKPKKGIEDPIPVEEISSTLEGLEAEKARRGLEQFRTDSKAIRKVLEDLGKLPPPQAPQ